MSMISKLIEELIDNADSYTKELHNLMYRAAETIEMLSEKAREPKQGEWIDKGADLDGTWHYQCSECSKEVENVKYPYCPYCLARMKGAYNE